MWYNVGVYIRSDIRGYAMAKQTLRHYSKQELMDMIDTLQQHVDYEHHPLESEEIRIERERLERRHRYRKAFLSTVSILIVVAAISVLLVTLLFPVIQVDGTSMESTLNDGDVLVLTTIGEFQTGDLIAFYYQNKLLLKRVIGLPGDTISIDEDGFVTVNGEVLSEEYVQEISLGVSDITYPYQVPEDRYFVMGDNRATSIDSRTTTIGCIESEQVVGRVIWRIYPFGKFKYLGKQTT